MPGKLPRASPPYPQVLPSLATQGPWWRAARFLRDCETALIAAGAEWLYRRPWLVGHGPTAFGPGEELPRADIPELDFAAIQREIFGVDDQTWPTYPAQMRAEALAEAEAAERELRLELAPDEFGPDIDNWERLTGSSLEELFPERSLSSR